jgi:hypothetical protein
MPLSLPTPTCSSSSINDVAEELVKKEEKG